MARILIVDDENSIRMMMRLALKSAGYDVDTAADGFEALERFGDGATYNLVLLDQRMPGMEGLEVLREMQRRSPRAKIIMATAFGTIDLAVEAMKAGATDFLRKPFTTEALRGAVQAALDEPPPYSAPPSTLVFGMTTINGFRIEFRAGSGRATEAAFLQVFTIRSPGGATFDCTVTLPAYVMELVKAHVDLDSLPGEGRFWTALCEEALANYLWQNADFPPESVLRVDEFTTGLRRFVDTVIAV